MNSIFKTFDEWKKLGYMIKKGSKANWDTGKPLFNSSQVKKKSIIISTHVFDRAALPWTENDYDGYEHH